MIPQQEMAALASPPWTRLLQIARRRLERSGGALDGNITLRAPSEDERLLVIGLTGTHRPPGVAAVTVSLPVLDRVMCDRFGMSLIDVLGEIGGPVRNRPGERIAEQSARQAALASASVGGAVHARRPWFDQWLRELDADGTVTKLVRRGEGRLLAQASVVLACLPAQDVPLPVLAELTTGNTKALSQTPLAGLVLRALALRDGQPAPATAAERRAQWESAGVVVDDLASQVLVAGIRPNETNLLAGWLRQAADAGTPFRATLQQLAENPITAQGSEVFVCENPAVLRAAAAHWGADCRPLVCSEGQPSAACGRLLSQVAGTVRWRGDFDWTGLRTTAAAITRYGAVPWRMSLDDYESALRGNAADPLTETEPLKGAPAPSPWEPALAAAMAGRGRAVMEERLLDVLVGDLGGQT